MGECLVVRNTIGGESRHMRFCVKRWGTFNFRGHRATEMHEYINIDIPCLISIRELKESVLGYHKQLPIGSDR